MNGAGCGALFSLRGKVGVGMGIMCGLEGREWRALGAHLQPLDL